MNSKERHWFKHGQSCSLVFWWYKLLLTLFLFPPLCCTTFLWWSWWLLLIWYSTRKCEYQGVRETGQEAGVVRGCIQSTSVQRTRFGWTCLCYCKFSLYTRFTGVRWSPPLTASTTTFCQSCLSTTVRRFRIYDRSWSISPPTSFFLLNGVRKEKKMVFICGGLHSYCTTQLPLLWK